MTKENIPEAVFSMTGIKRYDGNPFLEALPNKLSPQEFYEKLSIEPDISLFNPTDGDEIRMGNLRALETELFIPFNQQYYLYSKLWQVLYEGYLVRTPKQFLSFLSIIEHWDENTFLKRNECIFLSEVITKGFSLVGPSGAGKSTIITRILGLFQHSIRHQKFTQVPFIKIECPAKASPTDLAHAFFRSLSQKLGFVNYHELYSKRGRFTQNELIHQMANKAVLHWVGVIVIDEIQNLNGVSHSYKIKLLNILKKLNNEIAVPIVFVGTPEAELVLEGNLQQARRSQGVGSFQWEKLEYDSEDWKRVFSVLDKYQVLRNRANLNESIKRQYFMFSQGILALLIPLHIAVQEWAINTGQEVITPELVKLVGNREFKSTTKVIQRYQNHSHQTLNDFHSYKPSLLESEEDSESGNRKRPSPPKEKPAKTKKKSNHQVSSAEEIHKQINEDKDIADNKELKL
jgi:energy-coupling factor transporter ATP-binding protein EcfA2